jgi:hypothetical protein
MTDTVASTTTMQSAPAALLARKSPTEELAVELMERAQADGVSLVGPGGLLADLTRRVLEAGLEAELTEHVGYEPHDRAGHHSGNSRNGTRSKTVITDIGPVDIDVPRDRAGTFEPVIVPKGKRRLAGVWTRGVVAVREGSDSWGDLRASRGDLRSQGLHGTVSRQAWSVTQCPPARYFSAAAAVLAPRRSRPASKLSSPTASRISSSVIGSH